MTIRTSDMRRLLLSMLTASIFTFSPALAQQAPNSIAAVPFDDGYAFLEAPGEHIIGSDIAPNTLIIYASVTCPHCAHWFTTEWDLLKSELVDTGELRVVFREFITGPAQVAVTGFTLANCGQSENYMDIIYHQMREQKNILGGLQNGKGIEVYDSTLKVAGIKKDGLEACFADQSHFQRLETSMARAQAGGLQGVPSFILNGEIYKGSATAKALTKQFEGGISAP